MGKNIIQHLRGNNLKRARKRNVRRRWATTLESECSDGSTNSKIKKVDTSREEIYLTFVAYSKRYMEWKYVSVSSKGIHIRDQPQLHDVTEAENLLRVWEKAVVHGALKESDPFTSTDTLRIVEHRIYVKDITAEIAGDRYSKLISHAHLRDMDEGAVEALGLQKEKAEQLVFQNSNLSSKDISIMQGLEDRSNKYNIDI